ncbi:hypothetical protein [Vibrio agarivorans]|uniref:hypothetical protein n=1 Tax=Vibrio agarivorans TaxID=153622 RepID=UPI0025B48EDB|nr:hypothetical protein [Vibrio agarivorans]MDN3661111.1 hypothetical protein [Vibrio agarivorans]
MDSYKPLPRIMQFQFGNMFCKFDPTAQYADWSLEQLQASFGILVTFINNATQSLQEQLEHGYSFPTSELGGRTENGVYFSQYDDDEPLHAMLQIYKLPSEVVESGDVSDTSKATDMLEFFPYAIACFTDADGNQSTRRFD